MANKANKAKNTEKVYETDTEITDAQVISDPIEDNALEDGETVTTVPMEILYDARRYTIEPGTHIFVPGLKEAVEEMHSSLASKEA